MWKFLWNRGKVRVAMENSGEFITLEPGELGFAGHATLSIFSAI